MTDETENQEPMQTELEALMARADSMGIKYHPSIGLDKLKEKVNGALQNEGVDEDEAVEAAPEVTDGKTETAREKMVRLKAEAGALIRVRVTCMNPMKKEWEGEIFSAGNANTGRFKKYVPYETEWHVPQIILNMMEERYYQTFYTVKDPRTGQTGRRGKLVKEFAIEELPALTAEELKDLAQRQAMARGTAAA